MGESIGTTASQATPKRHVRNFLLDARFQLKFAGYVVALTLVMAGLLGVYLYRTTDSLFSQTQVAVDARSKAAETSRELGRCTLNNDLLKNDPEIEKQLEARSTAIDKTFDDDMNAVIAAKAELVRQQKVTAAALAGGLLVFIVFLGLGTIVVTHRVVGPLFRVKRMASEVTAGKLRPPSYGLRPGDELQDVFEAFSVMVTQLRERAVADAGQLDAAAAALGSGDVAAAKQALETVRTALKGRLD
jgi:HAMP domain